MATCSSRAGWWACAAWTVTVVACLSLGCWRRFDSYASASSLARRPYDLAARYGGEEFVLLLPAVPDMDQLLERLRTDVMALGLPHAGSAVAEVVTISIGAVNIAAGGRHDPVVLLDQADAMLYAAKHQGRNRMVSSSVASSSRFNPL